MYVHTPSNTLIMKLPDPSTVLGVLPRSRLVNYKGMDLVQVHFGLDEVRVLRNLGIQAPSPIAYNYEWRRNKMRVPNPFDHQITTSAFLTLHRQAICLNDMGTGKTLSVAWSADYLMDQGEVNKCIIVTPRSTMKSVWENELMTHFMFNRKAVVVYGDRQQRLKRLESDADFYIINHDGLKTISEALRERTDINLWVLDEAAQGWRNAQTDRYKLTNSLIRPTDWLWLLTGTPTPTAPTDAWGLARLMRSKTVPKYFNTFKEQTMMQISKFKWVPRIGATQAAYDILQPGIRYKKEDCISLPPVTFQYRTCNLSSQQTKAFADMQKQLVANIGNQQVTAANAAVKMSKLLQVTTGAVYDENHGVNVLDAKDRLDLVEEIAEEASGKIIVFVPFKAALKMVADHLAKRWTVAMVHGDVGDTQRAQIFDAFQRADDPRILVAHPGTTAHGLTLTAADTTIWYAPIFSLEIFEQANNRMNRPGQKRSMTVAMIAATALEMQLYKVLETRGNVQQEVLSMYSSMCKV